MKKLISFIAGVLFFVSTGAAFAATGYLPADQCHVPPDHGVYSADGSALVGCITQAAWDAAAAAQASRDNSTLPVVSAGSTITDEWGIQYPCGWYMYSGCVDLTKTPEYHNAMVTAGKFLLVHGDFSGRFVKLLEYVRTHSS